ncbi:DsbA family protein [Priestia endophytica]|uniref:DsbA family protein n=1 Tax=Priestia endophytica TaxID=135735 RepID=UPI002E24996F|nr:thioredoxin domain-containing protein [Priestia endophytica]
MSKKKKQKQGYKNTSKTKSSNIWFYIIIAVFVIGAVGLVVLNNIGDEKASFDYKNQPVLGEESAPVQIVEFGDYKCPVCKTFNETYFPQIDKELIQTGKVQFHFMNFPFINNDSTRAAQFAEVVYKELGDETFWKFHESLYKNQPADYKYEKIDFLTEKELKERLSEFASQEEVDRVVKAFKDGEGEKPVNEDLKVVNDLQINSTPTVYVNGKLYEGKSYEDLKKMVEEELEDAK